MNAERLPLQNRTIAIPESRQLDVLAELLERRGATTLRCPLVAILDAPDPAPVVAWLNAFIAAPPDDFVILTGEGIRRLLGCAERAGIRAAFGAALAGVRKIARGPKPGSALREIGLKPDVLASQPTTDGVIATLDSLELQDHRVGVQLYGDEPNAKLIDYLHRRGARPLAVAPYVYASQADDDKVVALIRALAAGRIDAIAFTSQVQYQRLQQIANTHQLEPELKAGLARTQVAAVGPIVAALLRDAGVRVDWMPESAYFMKPLVTALCQVFDTTNTRPAD
ncbi:MAG: uroporphyrinogen-III synthase [Gammaproteobacteria bacterium]